MSGSVHSIPILKDMLVMLSQKVDIRLDRPSARDIIGVYQYKKDPNGASA